MVLDHPFSRDEAEDGDVEIKSYWKGNTRCIAALEEGNPEEGWVEIDLPRDQYTEMKKHTRPDLFGDTDRSTAPPLDEMDGYGDWDNRY